MTAVWPTGTLGDAPEFADYGEQPVRNIIASPVDIGTPKRRRRFTGKQRRVTFIYTWPFSTYRSWLSFYEDDLNEGATDFTKTDKVRNEAGTFLLDAENPFTVAQVGPGHNRVTINAVRIS